MCMEILIWLSHDKIFHKALHVTNTIYISVQNPKMVSNLLIIIFLTNVEFIKFKT